jgi:hypothetical protein
MMVLRHPVSTSYPDVIGVTAVMARIVLVEAGAASKCALRAGRMAPLPCRRATNVRGTSFAAPGCWQHISTRQPDAAKAAVAAVIDSARDLGSKGMDKTYGYGMVGDSLRVALASVSAVSDINTRATAHSDAAHR